MKTATNVLLVAVIGLTCACASVPKELTDARTAYARAKEGPAAKIVPAELHKAGVALAEAEDSFSRSPRSVRTRDLSYVAQRKIQSAEVKASVASEHARAKSAQQEVHSVQDKIIKQTKQSLNDAKDLLAIPEYLEPEREVLITLSGSVIFASNQATLLPSAQSRLAEAAQALLADKNRILLIEGHTDSTGPAKLNRNLSRARAEAVRNYLVSVGYPLKNTQVSGVASARPVDSNRTAEGRANNRRVEIIVSQDAAMD